MDISVENLQTKVLLNPTQILKMTKMILHHEGVDKAVVAVVFVTRQKIKALNKKFLRRDYSTDVLAFDSSEDRDPALSGGLASAKPKKGCRYGGTGLARRKLNVLRGDIIISTDAAGKNAGVYGTSVARELALYMIHGVLHLLGYDDHGPADIQRMRRKEEELLEYLGSNIEKIFS